MSSPQPQNNGWREVDRGDGALAHHLALYPYLGQLPKEYAHYYCYLPMEDGAVVVVYFDKDCGAWQVGCSVLPSCRGVRAFKACKNWLNCYGQFYSPMQAECLKENLPAQQFAQWLGFKRHSETKAWRRYKWEGNDKCHL
jgi:hypothetical protein